jgi:ElaB/YqjD/DUF883 family membrane-anchored ribosome-binding protein
MATTSRSTKQNHRQNREHGNTVEDAKAFVEEHHDVRKASRDVAQYLTDYARENPGTAALACLGVGFVLGWKLKPW